MEEHIIINSLIVGNTIPVAKSGSHMSSQES